MGVRRALVVLATAASVLSVPAVASAVVDLGDGQALPDVDTRAAVAPTAAQLDAAKASEHQLG